MTDQGRPVEERSIVICGVKANDLLDGIEVRGLTAFLLEEVATADKVLTF